MSRHECQNVIESRINFTDKFTRHTKVRRLLKSGGLCLQVVLTKGKDS